MRPSRAPEQDLPDDDEERRDRIAGTEDQVVQEQVHESSHVPDEPGDDIDERHHGRELDRGYLGVEFAAVSQNWYSGLRPAATDFDNRTAYTRPTRTCSS